MRKCILFIATLLMLLSCGGKKSQTESTAPVLDDSVAVSESQVVMAVDTVQKQDLEAVRAFVEQFYEEWNMEDLLDYDYVKQHITPKMLKYLADSYDFDCEGECLATWKFFYEGGGDVGQTESRRITVRDENHVLVENKYGNYEYDVLLTIVKDGGSFKIDGLQQERSEYITENR
jgi:hypothetical protein